MTLLEFVMHPVTREVWAGIKYTTPRVIKAWQEHAAPKNVTEADIERATAESVVPDFDAPPTEGVENGNGRATD